MEQNIEELYEALGKIPDLVETTEKLIGMDEKNNRDYSAVVKAFNTLKAEVKSCQEVIAEAKQAFAKPVQIEDKNVHVTADQISVTQAIPRWVADMGEEYKNLKRQELSKKEKKNITIQADGLLKLYSIFITVIFLIWTTCSLIVNYNTKDSVEAYAVRAYNSAVQRHLKNPGDFYAYVKDHWIDDDEEAIKGVKEDVEFWERRAKKVKEWENYLTPLCGKPIIVTDYEYNDKEWVISWHSPEEEPEMVAHIWPNGRVDIADASKVKVSSIQDAQRTSKNKAWKTIREPNPPETK